MNYRLILLLVVICVLVAIYASWNKNKALLSGFKSGTESVTVAASKLPITKAGNNFCYSTWFYVKNWQYRLKDEKILIERGQFKIALLPYENNIQVSTLMYPSKQGESSEYNYCTIRNVPLQKWVNLIVSLNGRALDLYLDGKLVRTCVLPAVAKVQAAADVVITPLGGFSGWTSNLEYWAHPLNPQEAYNIYKEGYGQGGLGGFFEKYKIKVSYLVDNTEKGSFEVL